MNGQSRLRLFAILLAIIVIGFCVISFHLTQTENRQTKETFRSEMKTVLHDVLHAMQNEQGFPVVTGMQIDTTPKTQGNSGELERLLKKQMNRSLEMQNAYLIRLEKIGFINILDETRLQQDIDFSQSRAILSETHLAVKDAQHQSLAELDSLSDKINLLNADKHFKANLLQGIQQGLPQHKKRLNLTWSLEMQALDEISAIINLLEARKGHWSATDEGFLFESDQDLDAFNAHVTKISELAAQQKAAQQRQIDTLFKKVK